MGWTWQMLGTNKWENRDKTGKCSISQALKANFYCLSLNGKNTPHFTILTPNALFDSRIEPENLKKLCFEQIFKHSLNFGPFPSLISGLNSKFDYATYVFLIEVWLAKILF